MEPVFIVLVSSFVVASGLILVLTPPELLLRYDRRTGRAIYERALTQASPADATRTAAAFYRFFGLIVAGGGLVGCVVGLWLVLS